jgi:hypothetical protein
MKDYRSYVSTSSTRTGNYKSVRTEPVEVSERIINYEKN